MVWPIDENVLVEFELDAPLIHDYGAFGTVRKGCIRDNESGTDHEVLTFNAYISHTYTSK